MLHHHPPHRGVRDFRRPVAVTQMQKVHALKPGRDRLIQAVNDHEQRLPPEITAIIVNPLAQKYPVIAHRGDTGDLHTRSWHSSF